MIAGRLALAATALAVAAAAAVPGEPRDGLRLSAARGALRLANSRDGAAVLEAANMKPGETVGGGVAVTNLGAQPARLILRASQPSGGALAGALRVSVSEVAEGTLGGLAGCHDLGTLRAGETRDYRFSARWPASGDDNPYGGSSASADLHWELGGECVPGSPAEPSRLTLSHRHVALVRGRARLRVRCAGGACAGAIYLRPRAGLRRRAATSRGMRARFAVSGGQRATLYVPLPAASRAALRKRHRAVALAVVEPEGGKRVTRLVTLIRHAPRNANTPASRR